MKKLLSLLTLALLSIGSAWAEKIGFTSTYTDGKIGAPTVTTQDYVTVAIARGSQDTGNNKGTMYWGSTEALTYADGATVKQERTKYNGSALAQATLNDNVWTGASFVIASGYKFTVTDIQVDIAGQDYVWKYKLEVVNGDGTVEYTKTGTVDSPKNASKRKVTDTGKSIVLTGTSYIKLYYCLNAASSDSKYMYVPELYLTGTVEENVQSKYTKPSIVQGAYSQPNGTYAVTLSVQNDEDGTINYTVGTDDEVTGAASGTVINVAPSTKITAYVTGATYTNSDNAELTTSAAPKLATPTYSIGSYNLSKNLYTFTLSAAAGDITYTAGGGSATAYSGALTLAPGTTVTAYATQTNMTQSDNLEFNIPAAPVGTTSTTPTTASTYSNNVSYNMGSITIPGVCIAGQISSGTTPLNGSIKTRTNQGVTGGGDGFYVTVNPGYIVSAISIEGCSNQTGANACNKVYVDGVEAAGFSTVSLPLAEKDGSTGTITISGIAATSKIEFDFENNYQAQMIITVTTAVAADFALGSLVSGFNKAFSTFCAPQNFTITGATAYKAGLSGTTLTLTALDGVIPANTGVIIAGEAAADYTISYVADDATADVTSNDLKGVTVRTETSTLAGASTFLALNSTAATFQEYTGAYFPACKAYLLTAASAREIGLVFADSNTTGINALDNNSKATVKKYLKDGRLVIKSAKGEFNVAGARIK
jgi:hypothetical protein